jgi:hypothetical protein
MPIYQEDIRIADADGDQADVEQLTDGNHNIDDKYAIVTASALYLRNNGNVVPAQGDGVSSALMVVDPVHHEVHEGDHYKFCVIDEVLDSDEELRYILTTPNTTKWSHLVYDVSGSLKTKIELYESTTHTNGAPQTSYNSNRNSSNIAGMTVNIANSDGADGTEIECYSFGSATIGITGGRGGQSRGDSEWLLKQNTKYLVKVTSGNDGNNVSLKLSWYEHTSDN